MYPSCTTIALLTNEEVLDIDQDPLGKQANRRHIDGDTEIWARPLSDGTIAAGLFNRGDTTQQVTLRFSDLGLTGAHPVRDVWSRRDLGTFRDTFTAPVPPHGAVLVKVGEGQK